MRVRRTKMPRIVSPSRTLDYLAGLRSNKNEMHALIIEDDTLTAFMLKDMLGRYGFTDFDIAPTEARAVALAFTHPPDLITADMRLEQGTGAGAVRQISRRSEAPVIFITGNPEAVDALGKVAVLVKPVSEDELRRAVNQALRRRQDRTDGRRDGLARPAAG
jgi:DNA-binding response OmpR family regulator